MFKYDVYIEKRSINKCTITVLFIAQMPRGRPKKKTAVMTLRVDPRVKAAAEKAAERDNRSVTSLVEVLILDYCRTHSILPEDPSPQEPAK